MPKVPVARSKSRVLSDMQAVLPTGMDNTNNVDPAKSTIRAASARENNSRDKGITKRISKKNTTQNEKQNKPKMSSKKKVNIKARSLVGQTGVDLKKKPQEEIVNGKSDWENV